MDILGRTVSQRVKDNGSLTRTDIQYQSNRDGSPQFAEPQSAVVLGRSDLYTYDGLHRLSQADSGKLNSGRTDILAEWSDPAQTVYTMDILGNFTTIDHKHSGTAAAETRTHNATNELTSRTITSQAPQYWVNDGFADNDTVGYSVADLNTGGGDGTWSAASGQLQNDTVIAVTGSPDTGNGSILLVGGTTGGPYYQDVKLSASLTLSSGADNGGLVFGYRDKDNFWVLIASRVSTRVRLYEVSSGTWSQREQSSLGVISGSGGTYTVTAQARLSAVTNCRRSPVSSS